MCVLGTDVRGRSLFTGSGATKPEGGSQVLPLGGRGGGQVLAMLKVGGGGHNKFKGSFNAEY